jgi:LmbE family N-acetylglucosaminyl deacetylase
MSVDRRSVVLLLALGLGLGVSSPSVAQVEPLDLDRGATGLGLALRQVGTSGRVLYVTAHPDDEHNGVLVRLARGLGLHTTLLSLTRGEGGQNAIGPELFEALGVLRTQELMAMHRYDGVEQRFGRPYEFGFSFSVEETFEKWGREESLGDIVRVIRDVRPDVILTLPLESGGGGQHHQAAARLTRDAFRAAADPARFPEQLVEGRFPWQARKLYQGGTGGFSLNLPGTPVGVPTGVYDPLLGMTWQEIGSRARALHLCQGMGQLKADPGPARGVYFLLDAEPPLEGPEEDILDGLDLTLVGLSRLAPDNASLKRALVRLQEKALAARSAFQPLRLDAAVQPLASALAAARDLAGRLPDEISDPAARDEIQDRLDEEMGDMERALLLAQGVVVEARADDGLVTPGQTFGVTLSVWNQGTGPLGVESVLLEAPEGWTVESERAEPAAIDPGGEARVPLRVTVSPEARLSQPYWRRGPGLDRNVLLDPACETLPWCPPAVRARLTLRVAGVEATVETPAEFRYADPVVGGEKQHVVQVVPDLSVRVSPQRTVIPVEGPPSAREVRVFVRHNGQGPGEATVRLETPAGWSVDPAASSLHFAYEGEEVAARFAVTPPARREAGKVSLQAVAVRGGREYRDTVQEIAYHHIERRQRLVPAEVGVLVLDVRIDPAASVGYVMGSGDAVADGIRELGVPLTLLTAEDLAFGDLSRFSTIVTGIRAYETRLDLRSMHPRLMQYVEAGGNLVVQYNRATFNQVSPHRARRPDPAQTSPFAPYPAVTGRDRITDETAPLSILVPESPLLNTPNRIGDADWEGWVQERGTYFLETSDPRYVDLLAGADPFEKNPGEKRGILVEAKVGKGTWTYVGLVLFRQVPAGVPGGWRLLANLVSRPRGR